MYNSMVETLNVEESPYTLETACFNSLFLLQYFRPL